MKVYIWIICLLLTSSMSFAATQPSFQVEIPVENSEQSDLLSKALGSLISQHCGAAGVEKKAAKEALAKPDKYIKQFSYHEVEPNHKTIRVVFHPNGVRQLLGSIGIMNKKGTHQTTLVWLIHIQEGRAQWISEEQDQPLFETVSSVYQKHSPTVLLPLLDLEDLRSVSVQDILSENVDPFLKATSRYDADQNLLGQVTKTDKGWDIHWTLLSLAETFHWKQSGENLSELLAISVEQLKDKSFKRKEVIPNKTYRMFVSGIESADQYAKVLHYMEKLSGVSNVNVQQIMPERTEFECTASKSKEELIAQLAEDKVLIFDEGGPSDNVLLFRYGGT